MVLLMKYQKLLDNKRMKIWVEFNFGWNNLDNKTRKLFESLMGNEEITNKNDLLELDMLGLINLRSQ